MTSLYRLHVQEWSTCNRCELSVKRQRVVIARGKIPCDVLFIGEAPGHSEDCLGSPFKGPAGELLDHIIGRAMKPPLDEIRWAMTNLVGCIPLGEDGVKTDQPPVEAIEECKPRVEQLIEICKPSLVVAVGALSRDCLKPGYLKSIKTGGAPVVDITHPAAILRSNVAHQSLAIQRCVVIVRNAAYEYSLSKE